jgi:hypothetical protein
VVPAAPRQAPSVRNSRLSSGGGAAVATGQAWLSQRHRSDVRRWEISLPEGTSLERVLLGAAAGDLEPVPVQRSMAGCMCSVGRQAVDAPPVLPGAHAAERCREARVHLLALRSHGFRSMFRQANDAAAAGLFFEPVSYLKSVDSRNPHRKCVVERSGSNSNQWVCESLMREGTP